MRGGTLRPAQQLFGLACERLARRRQAEDPVAPAQERDAQLLLQRGHRPAGGGVADLELFRAAAEALLPGYGQKDAQLFQLHSQHPNL